MGKVYLIGAGPGAADLITVRGARLLGTADVVLHDALVEPAMLDYAPHARKIAVGKRCGQRSTAQHFINKQIVDAALAHDVVVRLKGGDPMLFGRADEEMRALEEAGIDYEVVPGITAMLAVAARIGAPLGHDFCAISLSDNLKPWSLIENRLRLVAEAGLVIALYNPVSKARPWQLGKAFDILREVLPADIPVVFGRAAGRPDERMTIARLADAEASSADMATCVIIGSAETRVIVRETKPDLVYTPRFVKEGAR